MERKDAALEAIKQASEIVKAGFGKTKDTRFKGGNPQDVVTETDIASEKIIIDTLLTHFPMDGIFAEESGRRESASSYTWVIDPVDGTTNFTRGIPCVSISIALLRGKETILGLVANPLTNDIYLAEKGGGACRNGERVHVSRTSELKKAFVCAEWWSKNESRAERGIGIFTALAKRTSKIRYLSGTVWNLTKVADGAIDLETCDTTFLDIAAMSLIIREAGGLFTDEFGRDIPPFDQNVHRVIAANHSLHRAVSDIIKTL